MEITNSERIVKLETQITNIDKKIDDHCTDNKEGFKVVLKKLDEMGYDIKDEELDDGVNIEEK